VTAVPGRLRSGLVVPVLFAVTAIVTFLALGTWQVERKAWKERLIEAIEQRVSAPPAALPSREQWRSLAPEHDEFRRVKFSAAFVPGAEALVYAGGSGVRANGAGPGYWLFALAQTTAGGLLVINRGWVGEQRKQANLDTAVQSQQSMEVIGVMRWPETRGAFTPSGRPDRNIWFVRDHLAIVAAKGWGEAAPFYIELEQPASGSPRPQPLKVNLRNDHLQYAITWYGLAGVVAVIFVLWLANRR
jgi:surfeit locus 1 family protein